MTRRKFYNLKSYWKSRFILLDKTMMELFKRERRGDIEEIPLARFRGLSYRLISLGNRGEKLLTQGVDMRMASKVLRDIRDGLNEMEMYSTRLKAIAEAKVNQSLDTFPTYQTNIMPTANLMEGVKSLDEILEKANAETNTK